MKSIHNHPNYWAFIMHRFSGLALVAFLPVHLYVLGLALADSSAFDNFISWSNTPLLKFLETVLVRLLALEFLRWRDWQKSMVALSCGISICMGLVFFLNAT